MRIYNTALRALICICLGGCNTAGSPPGSESQQTESSQYRVDVPYWVPLIDQCMAEGGTRNACIERLPPDVLADLENWERSQNRGALINTRNTGFGVRTADQE